MGTVHPTPPPPPIEPNPNQSEGREEGAKKNLPCVRGKRRECWLSSLFAGWRGRCLFWGRIRPRKFCLFPINKSTIRVQNTFSLQKVFGDSLAPAVSPKARSRNLSPLGKGKGERESPLYAKQRDTPQDEMKERIRVCLKHKSANEFST